MYGIIPFRQPRYLIGQRNSSPVEEPMAYGFLEIASTPAVQAAQDRNGSGAVWRDFAGDRAFNRFGDTEREFIAQRDSFYMATVSEAGWPYVQHRGGPPGFVRVLDDTTLGFADFRGNRQYISVGNLSADDRASLIMVDYPARRRLKLFVHAREVDLTADPDLAAKLAMPGYPGKAERGFVLRLEAFDWNCPQHITPRFTEAQIRPVLAGLEEHVAVLEAENRRLREQLAAQAKP